jgi:hypothetical protein
LIEITPFFAEVQSSMRETKLYHHLSLLSEQDRKQFRHFLASPYFNPIPRYVQLFDILDQQLLRYKLRQLSEEEAWALYFPGQSYDQNKFRKECTALLKLLTHFWAQQAFDQDPPQQSLYLLQQLNALGENHYFPGYAQDAQEILEQARAGTQTHYDKTVTIGIESYRHDLGQAARTSNVSLGTLIDAAELHYCVQKMELLYVELNHFLVTGKGKQRDDTAFLTLMEARLAQLPILTQIHYHLYQCTRDLQAEHHYRACQALVQTGQLPSQHLPDMYTALLNYCARRLNAGNNDYMRETHFLHRSMLDLGLLEPEHNILSPNYKNAVVVASRLGEFVWAKGLMQRFQDALNHAHNRNAQQYGEGVIAYHEGHLKRAEPFFHRVLDGFEDIYYGLDARGYLLRIYYETNNLIGLDALLESYRMYVKRTKELPGARKASHNEFIRLMRRLAHSNPHDRDALVRLRSDIEKGRKIPWTAWLMEKVDGLL